MLEEKDFIVDMTESTVWGIWKRPEQEAHVQPFLAPASLSLKSRAKTFSSTTMQQTTSELSNSPLVTLHASVG